jgi:hypothetical protein
VWWLKLGVGTALLAACITAAWLTLRVFCSVVVALHIVEYEQGWSSFDAVTNVCVALAVTLALYAIGSVMGTLIDRTVSALMASIVVAVALAAAITTLSNMVQNILPSTGGAGEWSMHVLQSLVVLTIPAFLALSYKIFTKGETLRTAKRFQILAAYFLPPIVLVAACVIAVLIVTV